MELIDQIREDWVVNYRDWTRPGFQALGVYRFGVWRMQIKPRFLRAPFSIVYRALYRGMRNVYGIELPYTATIGRRLRIEHQGVIVVHGQAVIGDDCTIHQGVTLGSRGADGTLGVPTLGDGVYVGANATVLGDVVVGSGAKVGAGAVVVCNVPAGATVGGVPARVLAGG
jgi:serine O-acetyltransferase